jgi:hypothetical protein
VTDKIVRRLAAVPRLAVGLARSLVDPLRRRELSQRLLEFHQYDQFLSAVAAPRSTFFACKADLIPFPLLVTTNRGLYLVERGTWRCLLPIVCFGIARHGDRLFLGASAGIYSFILVATAVGTGSIEALHDIRILARYETRYHNERIHQIAYDPRTNVVLGANCRRNSILVVDADGHGVRDEKYLFSDGTGYVITSDQNHINSITMNGDIILFTAHSAGKGGALGFVADDTVYAYQFPARGLHDIVIHDDGIMFTDSFRNQEAVQRPEFNGAIIYRGQEHLSQAIARGDRKLVLRGLAMKETTLVVGVSAYARREARLIESGGGIIVFRDGILQGHIEGPFAQIYDLLSADGCRTDVPGPPRSVAALDAMFRRDVGPLLYQGPVLRSQRPLS